MRIFTFLFLTAVALHAQAVKPTSIAVLPIGLQAEQANQESFLISQLEAGLMEAKSFRVMERSQIASVLKEQGFQQTGVCDSGDCQAKLGKILGVDKVVVTSVGYADGILTLTSKLVDVQSGTIEKVSTHQGAGTWTDVARQIGILIGRDLSAKPPEPTVPVYRKTGFWVAVGAVAIVVPTLIYFSSRTTTERSSRTVRYP